MVALVVALAVIVFVAAVLCSRLAQRLAPFVATGIVAALVQAGTGDWSLTIPAAGVLLVAAAFVATTRDLVSILRTSA
ncbi:MAG: hypothetical protein H0V68_07050 [Actinobacteria bacterium]|nr:hypothetical protein [Actinomycetota bacterium]